jgi:drug/metabolite transporter (DMT)-like permease
MSNTRAHAPVTTSSRNVRRAHVLLLFMVVIWGVNFPIAKAALGEMSPLAFNALRFPLAALVVLIALMGRGIVWPARGDRLRVLALGILANVIYQNFFIFGLAETRAGTASVLLAGTPIITALLSAAVGHERLGPRTWFGVVCTFIGIALVVLLGGTAESGHSSILGEILMIGASLSWAGYTVASRPIIARYGSVQFTAWALWVGTVGLCVIGASDVARLDFGAVSTGAWIGVLYAGAISIGLAYLIWSYGVSQIGNTRTATYSNLVPVVALLAAWVQLGEVPTIGQVIGAAVILGGITLAQAGVRRAPTGVEPTS